MAHVSLDLCLTMAHVSPAHLAINLLRKIQAIAIDSSFELNVTTISMLRIINKEPSATQKMVHRGPIL